MKRTAYILTIVILTSCQMRNSWQCDGDCFDGKGIKNWSDGGIEKGTWRSGELVGQGYQYFGKTSDFAGDYYEGEFNITYNGYGTYYYSNDDIKYIGEWKDGERHGKGKAIFGPNSDHPHRYYEGDWQEGLRHGYGIKFWGEAGKYTNNRYEGEWKDDQMDGIGRYDWPDQGAYIGPWKNGEQHGKGIYIFSNGDTLRSQWINGYCRELAVILYGEDASTFKTLLDEINDPFYKTSQKFIDKTVEELNNYQNNSSYQVDFDLLRDLLDSAMINQKKVIPRLENIKEYDEKIRYKRDFLAIQYALSDVMEACDTWLTLSIQNGEDEEIRRSFDLVFEKLKVMKKRQKDFEKTKKKFLEKYW